MPLKQMRDLLHAGERMGVEMEAVEALRGDIRRREWEENARKAVSTKASLSFITETLEEAERLGLEDTPAAAAVRVVYDKAAAWDSTAQQLLKRAAAAAAALQVKLLAAGVLPPAAADKQRGGRRSSAAGLAALAAAAAAAATPPPDSSAPARDGTPAAPTAAAGDAAGEAAEASAPPAAGSSEAPAAAAGGEPQPVTLEELGDLVTEGQGLGVKLERLYEAQRLHSSCHSWQNQVEEVQEAMAAAKEAAVEDPGSLTSEDLPSAADLAALLLQGAQTGVALEGLEGLQQVLEEGKGWQAAAAQLLEAPGDAGQVAALQQLLLEGQRSGIAFDELAQVEARLAALQWEGEVRTLFGEQLGPFLERQKQLKQEREQRAAQEAEEQQRAEAEAAAQEAEEEAAAQGSAEAPVVKQEPSQQQEQQQQQQEEEEQAGPVAMETEEAPLAQQQQEQEQEQGVDAAADDDKPAAAAAAAEAEAEAEGSQEKQQQQQRQGSSAAADVEQAGKEEPEPTGATTPAAEDAPAAAAAEPQQEEGEQQEKQEEAEVKEEAEEGSEGAGSEEGSAAPVVGKGRAGKRQHGSSTATGISPAAAAAHHQQQCLEQLPSLEDQAAQQEGKVPLGEVRRLLEAAEKLPVDEELQEALAAWVEEGEEWEERAGGVLSGEGLEGQPEASVASVVELIQAGLAQPLR
jgi:hypothetical protein